MKNKFCISYDDAVFHCEKGIRATERGELKKWWISAELGEVTAKFELPENYAQTRVFQFVESIANNFV